MSKKPTNLFGGRGNSGKGQNRFNGFSMEDYTMAHSFSRLWIHAIWSTKDRLPMLKKPIRAAIIEHIRQQFEELGCDVRIVNGTPDHLHALFLLSNDRSLAEVMKAVKGESSHWVNHQDLIEGKFSWQIGYGGFSVSESMINKVQDYILKQEEHHKKMTFYEEYRRLLEKYGFAINR